MGEIDLENGVRLCPKRPYWAVCDQDPTLRFPASCDAYRCEICGPRKARTAAAVMTWAAAQVDRRRLLTLTLLPDDWQRARGQVREFLYRLRSDGYEFEMAWAIEVGRKTGMVHAHGIQHGDYVPQRLLQDRWGGRRVDVRAMAHPGAGVYAVKEALRVAGYVVKNGTESASGLGSHLDRNGGRVVHMTRGFLHGMTKREALEQVSAEQSDGQHRTWHLELDRDLAASA